MPDTITNPVQAAREVATSRNWWSGCPGRLRRRACKRAFARPWRGRQSSRGGRWNTIRLTSLSELPPKRRTV